MHFVDVNLAIIQVRRSGPEKGEACFKKCGGQFLKNGGGAASFKIGLEVEGKLLKTDKQTKHFTKKKEAQKHKIDMMAASGQPPPHQY